MLLDLWFCCENCYDKPKNCYDKPNEIKFLGPKKWGIFIGKGVRLFMYWLGDYAYQSARTFFSDVPITFVLRKNEVVIPLYGRVLGDVIYFLQKKETHEALLYRCFTKVI